MTEENTTTTTTETEEQENGLVTEPADTTVYTLDKQMLDQERANARRAREELASVSELYEQANERAESFERELEEIKSTYEKDKAKLEAAQQEEQDKLDEMDPDIVDEKVIKNIKVIENKLKRQSEKFEKEKADLLSRIQSLSTKTSQYEKEQAEIKKKAEREKAIESVLSRVEKSLQMHNVKTPGQYRTEAMKMADDMVDKGECKKPENILEGVELMEKCYLLVIEQQQKKKGVSSVDDGKSGLTPGAKAKDEIKPGSLSEVKAQMLKNKSWLKD